MKTQEQLNQMQRINIASLVVGARRISNQLANKYAEAKNISSKRVTLFDAKDVVESLAKNNTKARLIELYLDAYGGLRENFVKVSSLLDEDPFESIRQMHDVQLEDRRTRMHNAIHASEENILASLKHELGNHPIISNLGIPTGLEVVINGTQQVDFVVHGAGKTRDVRFTYYHERSWSGNSARDQYNIGTIGSIDLDGSDELTKNWFALSTIPMLLVNPDGIRKQINSALDDIETMRSIYFDEMNKWEKEVKVEIEKKADRMIEANWSL